MTKKILLLLLWTFFYLPSQAAFIEGTEDLPQMRELVPIEDLSMSFDTPEGRIFQSYQQSESLSQKQVEAFYKETLPALGWTEVKKNIFEREKEQLSLSFEKVNHILIVRFELKTDAFY